ncbi:hypothetical protein C8034_v004592 [Colletotrichum sidae]|uniref:Rhodopsin domain-containing protein n=1 Tax=Colletotrichum sidae TaxID=1347389 RepID=A0A4R8TU42_9PEZI|nr:hypothetical protein C8034_v004592 [Colletotrichum sidae]
MSGVNPTMTPLPDPEYEAESNTARIIAVVTIFHALALASVGMRLYARIRVIKTPGWDDWVMILTALCAMGGWIVFVIQANHGLGKHFSTIDKDDYVKFQHAGFFQSIISAGLAIGFLKVSIGLNLLRLATNRWFKWALIATMSLSFIQSASGIFTFTFYCQPTAGFWDKSITPKPKCWPISLFVGLGVMNTALNIVTDVILATLPIPIIWNLQMKRKVRLYVIGILSLGYFAVGVGIVKAVYQIGFGADPDKTFKQSIQFWGFLQLQLGIIAASAPALKPLVSKMLRLTSYDDYTREVYGSHSHVNATIGGTRRHTMPDRNPDGLEHGMNTYELSSEVALDGGSPLSPDKGKTTTTAEFYKQNPSEGAGSEESILQGDRRESVKGIMKTTEVTVK